MRERLLILTAILLTWQVLISCGGALKGDMPEEMHQMHDFLTQKNPESCGLYHYNFERQAPRLYADQQTDSILNVIDYIKGECGPSRNLEITRMLVLAQRGQFDDSLIGTSTAPMLLQYRTEQEYQNMFWSWNPWRRYSQPVDNTHDNFNSFVSNVASEVAESDVASSSGKAIGLVYSNQFDSAFSFIQSDELRNSPIQYSYNRLIGGIKEKLDKWVHFGFTLGNWSGSNGAAVFGNHPEIGIQMGGEGKNFRTDFVITYRFASSKNKITVDSSGTLIQTQRFNSWLLGIETGYKFFNTAGLSTDFFVGVGYDVILTAILDEEPIDYADHSSINLNFGLRQRIFLNKRTGLYLGGIVRFSYVNYGNKFGTDISGNTVTLSLVTGWSANQTRQQYLKGLNYKGNWRD